MNRRYRKLVAADAPREPCPDCVRKHLGQAAALLQESLQGYPDHLWLAVGHMAEAEAESQGIWPDLAEKLRDERKKMESGHMPDFVSYINEVTKRVTDGAIEAATKIDRTETGSKLDFRLTYPSGSKKWTDDRPGDGKDPNREDYLEDLFSRGDVKRGLKVLEKAVGQYVSDGNEKPIKDAVAAMLVDAGSDVTKDVIRRVYKVEKAQLDEKKSDGQEKLVKGLGIAKKKVNED